MTPITIFHRNAELRGGAWNTVATLHDLADAHDFIGSWMGPTLAHGDLARVVGDHVDDLYVFDVARSSLVEVPELEGAGPLFEAWEGDSAKASSMMDWCEKVDHRRLTAMVCDIAESVLKYVPDGEERPRRAIETTRAWLRGQASRDRVGDADDGAVEAIRVAPNVAADFAASAAATAADMVFSFSYSVTAREAIWDAESAAKAGGDLPAAIKSQTNIARQRIPLTVLACSLVGASDPLPNDLREIAGDA